MSNMHEYYAVFHYSKNVPESVQRTFEELFLLQYNEVIELFDYETWNRESEEAYPGNEGMEDPNYVGFIRGKQKAVLRNYNRKNFLSPLKMSVGDECEVIGIFKWGKENITMSFTLNTNKK